MIGGYDILSEASRQNVLAPRIIFRHPMQMKKHQLDWVAIDEAASRLGVSKHARLRWRDKRRGVPFKLWVKIVHDTGGKVTFKHLQSTKGEATT